ncbi:hypothetical protein [Streptomyces sp. NPDC006645]|uniref:hypothetical protein n=1 Tax=unclassified Streptomyces TaxID=2593676 RepID=UPI0033B133BA
MTAHPLTVTAPDADGLASAFRERGLRQALVQLRSVGSAPDAASMGAVVLGYRLVWQVTGPWIDLAFQRLEEALDSPCDTARWQRLIGAVQSPSGGGIAGATYEGLLVLVGQARDLLRALIETEQPCVPVAEVARRITRLIESGTYPPGSAPFAGNIAADLNIPAARVHLALQDLAEARTISLGVSGRPRIPGGGESHRPRRIAEWLTSLIANGVYPTRTFLPVRTNLVRSLVSSGPNVRAALHLMADEGTLTLLPKGAPVVRPDLPFPLRSPVRVLHAAQVLKGEASTVQLSAEAVRHTVRVSHNWWRCRTRSTTEVSEQIRILRATAGHLIPLAVNRRLAAEDETQVRRAAFTALAELPADPVERVWRAACIGASLLDLLRLAQLEGAPSSPETS